MGLCRRGSFAAQSYGSGLSRRALRPPVLIRTQARALSAVHVRYGAQLHYVRLREAQ